MDVQIAGDLAGAVFGHSLQDVIQKERMSTSSSNRSSTASQGNGSISMPTPPMPRRRINSSTSSEFLKTQAQESHSTVHMSTRNNFRRNSLLIDALSLSVDQTIADQRRVSLEVREPQVPQLVTKAMQFIESKGELIVDMLTVLCGIYHNTNSNPLIVSNHLSHCPAMMTEGIFRIPGAKNRINQVSAEMYSKE